MLAVPWVIVNAQAPRVIVVLMSDELSLARFELADLEAEGTVLAQAALGEEVAKLTCAELGFEVEFRSSRILPVAAVRCQIQRVEIGQSLAEFDIELVTAPPLEA